MRFITKLFVIKMKKSNAAAKYDSINWFDLPDSVYVRISEQVRKEYIRLLVKKCGSFKAAAEWLNQSNGKSRKYSAGDVHCWMTGGKKWKGKKTETLTPKWAFLSICEELSENPLTVQDSVLGYKAWGRGTMIATPNLPIQVSPEFASIFFHFLGDGHIGGYEDSSTYRQMNDEGLKQFLDKLFLVFGEFKISQHTFDSGKVLVPLPITQIITGYFGMDASGFSNTFLSPKVFELPREHKVAGLAAFILDEGHITNRCIELYSHNARLLKGMRQLVVQLGYECSEVKGRDLKTSKTRQYRFRLNKKGSQDFARDLKGLLEEHPLCSLGCKQPLLEKYFC